MKKPSRALLVNVLAIAALLMPAAIQAQKPPLAEATAKEFGLDSWDKIEAIRYTFNVSFPGVNLSRTWTWEPKTSRVTYEGKDKEGKPVKVTYLHSDMGSQSADVKENID